MPQSKDITIKSTKAELFGAYEEMKEKFQQSQKDQISAPQKELIKKEEEKIINKTAEYTPDNVENDVNNLRQKIQLNLNNVKDSLIIESEKLQNLRQAVKIETNKLEEIYNIQLAADTLKVLIEDYSIKQKDLENQNKFKEEEIKEIIEQKKKLWEREQEEYKYNLKLERQKEQDLYEATRLKEEEERQKEMNQREYAIKQREEDIQKREEEFLSLKQQVEDFPNKLEGAVNDAKKQCAESLKKEFNYDKQLVEQKWLAEKNVLEVNILNLKDLIKRQGEEISSLRSALSDANQRAQNLAVTVVEGNSRIKKFYEKEDKQNEKGEED